MKILLQLFIVLFLINNSSSIADTYNIKDFGAVGDGETNNRIAIQNAINKCRDAGGGTVLIPTGIFITGTIQLFSNINLHLESGAVLKGSPNVAEYYLPNLVSTYRPSTPTTDKGGTVRVGLIFTENAHNVFISGDGNIDGNGDVYMNLKQSKVFDTVSTQYTRQKSHYREVLEGLGDGPLVPLDRPYQMIIFSNCKNVNVTGIMISNSPFWTLHFADCDGVTVSGLKIWNNLLIPNNDGIDFTSCSNVLVDNCDIRTGDDAIVLTGYAFHFDLPGYQNLRHDSQHITVSNCYLVSRSSAIRIGGWDQNFMRDYTFSNIVIDSSNRGINLCVRDEKGIENVTFSNMIIKTRMHTGDWWGNGEPVHLSVIRGKEKVSIGEIKNIKFSHIICEGEAGMLLYSSDESIIENVSFTDISFRFKESKLNPVEGGNFDLRPATDPKFNMFSHDIPAFYAQRVKNIQIHNFELKWDNITESYFTNGIEFSNFDNVLIDGFTGSPAPSSKNSASIKLENGKRYRILNFYSSDPKAEFLIKDKVEE